MPTQVESGWGEGPSARYDVLAERFRPTFARIRAGAVEREARHLLPVEEIGALKALGFTALRLPEAEGGAGATVPELFNLLIELSAAESNITQALRGHFAFVEDVLQSDDPERRALWLPRFARGDTAGNAWTEIGQGKVTGFTTRVAPDRDGVLRLNGAKYYTTGSYFADWVDVGATDAAGNGVGVSVRRNTPGVEIVDDWDGFGQQLTASGTATFRNVPIDPAHVVVDEARPRFFPSLFQLFHLATLAGIARAAADDVAAEVGRRRRTYSHANGPVAAQDPQVLQVVGRVRGAAYVAGAVVLQNARAVQRAIDARSAPDAEYQAAVDAAEVELCQSLTPVTTIVLDATTLLFDALGASAGSRALGLDRHWRNARTLASHNPRIYKDRIVGDYAVNGTKPPPQWRIGLPE